MTWSASWRRFKVKSMSVNVVGGEAPVPVREHFVFATRPEFFFDQVLVEFADAGLDVIAVEHKLPPVLSNPTDQQVNVVVVGVAVVDGYPFELGAEVALHSVNEV